LALHPQSRYTERMPSKVVIIEDEKDIVELVRYNFRKEGFVPLSCAGESGTAGRAPINELKDISVCQQGGRLGCLSLDEGFHHIVGHIVGELL
jgi:hypothetical protein